MKRCLVFFLACICTTITAQKSDFKHIDFTKADSIARTYNDASLKNMPLLVHNLTHNLNTQVEQFRAIHTWVCYNIESDHYFSKATLNKRRKLINKKTALKKWNTKQQTRVFKRLVMHKKTICSGYAYLLKTLTNLVDIECNIVDGYARTLNTNVTTVDFPNHSWNVVKLNGKWYFADTTQASGSYNLNENEYVKNYNDGYFLAEPKLFAKNHYPIDKKWLLLDGNTPLLQDFVNAPIIYGSTYKYSIEPVMPKTLVTTINTGEIVVFQFNILDKAILENISLVLSSGFKFKKITATKVNFKNGILELRHRFDKKGQYDLHAKVGEDIVVSYTVEVKH